MICKKCGNEIKEENLFCTNCGTSINENTNQNREPIRIKLSTFLILVVAIAVIFIFSVVIFGKKSNTNQTIINDNIEIEDVTVVEPENNIVELETDNVEETFGDTYDDTTHLLEQIYAKYPELKGENGIVCSNNYNEFWLLDEKGKKMYFTNIEGFEAQLPYCPSAQAILNKNSSKSSSSNTTNTLSNDEKNRLYPEVLLYKTEEKVKSILANKDIPYKIEYQENKGFKEGDVIGYKIVSNREEAKKGNYIDFQDGESLIVYVCKYENRTLNFNIDIASLIAEYTLVCKEQNITMDTTKFLFELKVDNKNIFSKTISNEEAKEAMKTDEKIEDYPKLQGSLAFRNNYTSIKTSYTGYGVLNYQLCINGVDVYSSELDCYRSPYSNFPPEQPIDIDLHSLLGFNGAG